MSPDIPWEQAITDRFAGRPRAVKATTYYKKWASASRPFLVSADDGNKYVVKSGYAGRQIVNDQIVGRIAEKMGAPAGRVALVDVTQELIDLTPELQALDPGVPLRPGVWHGSLFVQGYSDDREGFRHQNLPENRPRFATLATLYGWAFAGSDHQFLYKKDPPPLVLSVDHGHFFPGGPEWREATLQSAPSPAVPDALICAECSFSEEELRTGIATLRMTDPVDIIAGAVAIPPDDWQIQMSERVAIARYLYQRREELFASTQPDPSRP